MTAYYNEHDKFAAAWLRELIKAGHIAPGVVDERSIEDVMPIDVYGFTQCHFFAGIGGWSLALRLAGWPDDRPVWTGSCPCQPFSAAGKGAGAADERHLWPAFFHLIEQCQPGVIFGEQVEAAIKHGWLDLVQADMEGIGYAFAPVGLPAAGVGAPHIRQRLWFVADAEHGRGHDWRGVYRGRLEESGWPETAIGGELRIKTEGSSIAGELADTNGRNPSAERQQRGGEQRLLAEGGGADSGMVNPMRSDGARLGQIRIPLEPEQKTRRSSDADPWAELEFIGCADGKARPTQPGLQPLAHGVPARVGRLRGYGNAIVPQVAAEVIGAYLDAELLR